MLIDAALILTVDSFLRRTTIRPRAVGAVIALVAVLCVGWIPDYRYWGNRSNADQLAGDLVDSGYVTCEFSRTGVIRVRTAAGRSLRAPLLEPAPLGAFRAGA